MKVLGAIPQLRTTDLASSIRFYTEKLGLELLFQHQDFYAGIRVGGQGVFHLKLVDEPDPSVPFAEKGDHFHLYFEIQDAVIAVEAVKKAGIPLVRELEKTPWGTREFVIRDDQGHTLYFGENCA